MTRAAAAEPELFGPGEKITPKGKSAAAKQPAAKTASKPTPKNQLAVRGSGSQAPAPRSSTPQSQPVSLLVVIQEASRDPKVDVAKMRELITMAREEEDRQRQQIFSAELAEAQSKMPRVRKDKKGENSWYARLETVSEAVDPILHAHGFSISYGMADSSLPNHYRITAVLRHKTGWSAPYFIDLPADTHGPKGNATKTGVQGIGSTISYGRRYLKLMICDVTIIGEDNDGARGPAGGMTAAQKKQLKAAIDVKDVDVAKFCEHFGVEAWDDLPADKFDAAIRLIGQK